MQAPAFRQWNLEDPSAMVPIFSGCCRGIYVLHFANGDRYVGQAENVVVRYMTHRHGSRHHLPWKDIVAIEFCEIPEGDLNEPERETIRRYRSMYTLRNKTFNFGHLEPSLLDAIVPVEVQRHWATEQPTYDRTSFAAAAQQESGLTPKLLTKRRGQERLPDGRQVGEAVIDELAQVVAEFIPDAVDTERLHWSISDYPDTAGGRFATLNVGWLELAVFPRRRFEADVGSLERSNGLMWFLNADIETFIDSFTLPRRVSGDGYVEFVEEILGQPIYFDRAPNSYSVPVDRVMMPLGTDLAAMLTSDEIQGVRQLALKAMRAGSARLNARSYSPELTRHVYQRIVEG